MSDVQINPNFHRAAASELIAGRWGYMFDDIDGEFTLFLCVDESQQGTRARIIQFSTKGVLINRPHDGAEVLLLEGEIEIDVSAKGNFALSRLQGVNTGTAVVGIYSDNLVLAVATTDYFPKLLYFNFTNSKIEQGLVHDAFWWKAASIRYRKDPSREWMTLHSL